MLWRKGSACQSGSCVEVAAINSAVFVRDSRNSAGVVIGIEKAGWIDFVKFLQCIK